MNLRSVHALLILFSAALAVLFGIWCLSLYGRDQGIGSLVAAIAAFAVSFGIASWGMTDSAALLPRTLVAPVIMLCAWWWLRFDGRAIRYLVFPILILASSTFRPARGCPLPGDRSPRPCP